MRHPPSAAPPGARSDRNDETFENDDSVSAFVVDPTLIAVEIQAGDAIELVDASLPEAITVGIPTERRLSIMGLRGSSSQFARNCPPPRLMFTAAMLYVVRHK